MKRGLDNAIMLTDLDANHLRIRNLGSYLGGPPPGDLVGEDDPRLNDSRTILPGTVIDDSVADDAGIVQSKINFNGDIPTQFLGTDQAARGDLVQQTVYKDQINGYAALDVNGKLNTGKVPVSGTGTLKEINFNFPIGEFTVIPSESTTTRTSTGFLMAQDAGTILANLSGAPAAPSFIIALSVDLIPNFDANKFGFETFTVDQLPVAKGVGVDHAPGLVPEPGVIDPGTSAQPDDYLGRDMLYHAMKPVVSIQPQLPPPSITIQSYYQGKAYVNISTSSDLATIFYSVDSSP